MSAALAQNQTNDLTFARSESKTTGVKGGFLDTLRDLNRKEKQWEYDNAPRVAGIIKLVATLLILASADSMLVPFAVFGTIAQLISVAYGSKSNQQKQAGEKKHTEASAEKGLLGGVKKIFHPKQYPVEANAGFSAVAEVFETGYGIKEFMGGGTGFTPIILGVMGLSSYVNVLFGKEKKKEEALTKTNSQAPLFFTMSQSKPAGLTGRLKQVMKNNPVLTSYLMLTAICVGGVIGSILEQKHIFYIGGLALAAVANLTQALLVRKSDYNIEGTAAGKNQPATFQDRIEQQRSRDDGLGVQPV